MSFKVKGANLVAVVLFGLLTFWLGDTMVHGSIQTFELLFVPAFFSLLAFIGFTIGFFAYGNGGEK